MITAPIDTHPRPPRRFLGLGSGQIVALQLAILLVFISFQFGTAAVVGAVLIALLMAVLGWGRSRGRWLSEWFAIGLRYKARKRRHTADAVLQQAGSQFSAMEVENLSAAMVSDVEGLTALIEIGDAAVIPSHSWYALPSPVSLLPAPAPDTPPVRIQLLLHAIASAGATPVGASYRQLTGGRLLAGERALLAVRIQRSEGWSEQDLERALHGALRKVRSKLGDIPNRLLGEAAALRTLDEIAGYDGSRSATEGWSAMHLGGLLQATYKVERWPHPNADPGHAIMPRLLRLPATMTTVSLTAGPWTDRTPGGSRERSPAADQVHAQLMIRLAAPDQTSLGAASNTLRQMLATDKASARRLDGEQIDGLLATLPLAGPTPVGLAPDVHFGLHRTAAVAALTTPYGGSGLMIGVNRHNEPVSFRLFRPEVTRAVLIGGVPVAQIIAARSMALGAYVLVQTTRPHAWEAFSRGLGAGAALTVMAPGPVTVPPGSPMRPLLTVVDAGPVAADRSAGSAWHSTLVVRDDLSPVDLDVLSRADLALLQPLNAAEAAVAVSVLGLSRDQEAWMARAQPGMLGVVHRRSVRWAALSQTSYEQQLIGSTVRER